MFKAKKNIKIGLIFLTVFIILASYNCKSNKIEEFNVVLIVIDTLRADHLPFHGYKKNTAPFLWELSKESVLFENTYSASSWTSPATASIFTSLYPFQHGVLMGLLAIRNAQKIDPNFIVNKIPESIKTLPEILKENGYSTYGISDNLNIGERQGFTQGFDKFTTFMYQQAPQVNKVIKKWRKELLKSGKYFLYIHYMDPHAPYHRRKPWHEPDQDKRKNRISAYDSEINYVDQHIKELFELFEWKKNTLFIITSDHGEGLWDHGLMGHGKTLYREEIQVPLMIYLPGGSKGSIITDNVSTVDIVPTVLNLIGLPKQKANEGLSLVPLIKNPQTDFPERDLFSYLWVQTKKRVEWRATIYKNWHFMVKLPDSRHLYSLLLDKKETSNKIVDGQKIAEQLEKRFNIFYKISKKFKQETSKQKLDKKKIDKLKSLGYVE